MRGWDRIVWVGIERTQETLDRFFEWLGPEGCAQIECLAMDMWEPFRASCRRWIADADNKTVLDRFHLDKHLNEVRKAEHRALQEQGIELLKRLALRLTLPARKSPARIRGALQRTAPIRPGNGPHLGHQGKLPPLLELCL